MSALLQSLGGEPGCKRIASDFYARVKNDPTLRPFFPGKTLKCATEEFAAFLVQFLGGDEAAMQKRWRLSLRESHARFPIGPAERAAWLRLMSATLDAAALDDPTRAAFRRFFEHSSAHIIARDTPPPDHPELAAAWSDQLSLDDAIAAIVAGRDEEVLADIQKFHRRRSVFLGLLVRMLRTGREPLIAFVIAAVESDPVLVATRWAGRPLLHYAAATGRLGVLSTLLRLGADPRAKDAGGHTALYAVANECASEAGPEVVRALLAAGADVNAAGGVTRATPLHMAARRDHVEIARALLDAGAAIDARDRKGVTPLQRAISCRQPGVVDLLRARGAGTA